tara:strand:- start:395 stop:2809 length:2415 start_codon:yes stop_codon:yes gene_type:complete
MVVHAHRRLTHTHTPLCDHERVGQTHSVPEATLAEPTAQQKGMTASKTTTSKTATSDTTSSEIVAAASATPTAAPKNDIDCEYDKKWVESVTRMPAAKPILQHFAACSFIVKSDEQKGSEAPTEQVALWRRMFCWMYNRTDTPFGIVSPVTSAIPKCICICSLSGSRAFYFSDNLSLGRILCRTSQESSVRIISGVNAVFNMARQIDASVVVFFCLPFQAGMERCYWEVRTIRKTKNGVVKDGEMFFSVNDQEARMVPCTLSLEHWPDSMLHELCKTFMTVVSPVCLDYVEDTQPATVAMTLDKAMVMIGILKAERKKLIDEHKRNTDALKAKALDDVRKRDEIVKDAEYQATTRVENLAKASKDVEETVKKKMAVTDEHNASLLKQLASQKNAVDLANSMVASLTLEHEQEINAAAARQKATESQVSSMQSSHAKQVLEQTKAHKDMTRSHQKEIAKMKKELEDSKKKTLFSNTAAELVSRSADEARRAHADAKAQLQDALTQLATTNASLEEIKKSNDSAIESYAMLQKQAEVARTEITNLKDALHASESRNDQLKNTINESDEARMDAEEALRLATQASPDQKNAKTDEDDDDTDDTDGVFIEKETNELDETKAELGRKEHLLKETEKRTKALESRILELETEIRDVKKQAGMSLVASGKGHGSPSKRRGRVDTTTENEQHAGPLAQNMARSMAVHANPNTVHANPNGAIPPPHQHGFPANGNFVVDPMLEGMISQMHSALQTITATARSASSKTRDAEIAHAKLDALMGQQGMGQQGMGQQGMGTYYDGQQMQPQYFPHW